MRLEHCRCAHRKKAHPSNDEPAECCYHDECDDAYKVKLQDSLSTRSVRFALGDKH